MTMHEDLVLVCGFEKGVTSITTPTAEAPLDQLSFMGGNGFELNNEAMWIPQLPALKGGGVWAESSTSVGRVLIAGEDGNVTENISLIVGTGDPLLLHKYIIKLNRLIELCRQHWTTFFQTLPVYLKWKAVSGVGYQYALVYNIDVSIDYPGVNTGLADVTLSIEREPYWRGAPPGANPKRWYFDSINQPLLNSNMNLNPNNSNQWKHDSISNKHEWTPTALGLQTTPLSRNYIQIDGANVPGDAPALVEIGVASTPTRIKNLYIAKSTKPTSGVVVLSGFPEVIRHNAYIMAAGDAGVNSWAAKSVVAANTGLISNGSSVNPYIVDMTVDSAFTTFQRGMIWGPGFAGNLLNLSRTLLSGKYAVFLRSWIPGTGAAGDVILKMTVEEFEDDTNTIVSTQMIVDNLEPLPNSGGGLVLLYAGIMTTPFAGKRSVSPQGWGRQIPGTTSDVRIILEARNTAGADRVVRVSDLILLPIDDEAVKISVQPTGTDDDVKIIYDNTGYFDLSNINGMARAYQSNAPSAPNVELSGGYITLEPGRNQRLYFIWDSYEIGAALPRSYPNDTANISVNIVPRWRGVRDA